MKTVPAGKAKAWAQQDDPAGEDGDQKSDKKSDKMGKRKSAKDMLQSVVARIANGDVDDKAEEALADFDAEAGDEIPSMVQDKDLWHEAEEAVEPESDEAEEEYDDPWLVCAMVYLAIGGELGEGEDKEDGEKDEDKEEAEEADAEMEDAAAE